MPTIAELTQTLRHETDLGKIAGTVQAVTKSRLDLVAPQSAFSISGDLAAGTILDPTGEPMLTDSGVMPASTEVAMTRLSLRQTAERLRIPVPYLDRLAGGSTEHQALAATNVNELARLDDRKALYRLLVGDDGTLLRSVLSDRYGAFDNELALRAMMEGLDASGLGLGDCVVEGDVTDSRFRLRVHVPSVAHDVTDLLGDYKMPFSMREDRRPHDPPAPGERPPVLWAGFEIGNSETGAGTFYVAERAVVGVCRNGLKKDVQFKKAHLGASMEDGKVEWSSETRQTVYDLIRSQVRDVMVQCLTTDRLAAIADEMRSAAGIEVDAPKAAIEVVTAKFGLTEAESDSVFDCFARGGDQTVLGVANAVTAAAQLVEDGDRQAEMEAAFWPIVEAPAAYAAATA
jgi:hypothetical protein